MNILKISIVACAALLTIGCGGGSSSTPQASSSSSVGSNENESSSVDSSSSESNTTACTVEQSGIDWSDIDNSTIKNEMLNTSDNTVSNTRYALGYAVEGDCVGEMDITRVVFAKFDFKTEETIGNYADYPDSLSVAINANGQHDHTMFSLYLDTDEDAATGYKIAGSDGIEIGADSVLYISLDEYNYDSRYTIPERMSIAPAAYAKQSGDLFEKGWYSIYAGGQSVLPDGEFKAIVIADKAENMTLIETDRTPVFTVEPF